MNTELRREEDQLGRRRRSSEKVRYPSLCKILNFPTRVRMKAGPKGPEVKARLEPCAVQIGGLLFTTRLQGPDAGPKASFGV